LRTAWRILYWQVQKTCSALAAFYQTRKTLHGKARYWTEYAFWATVYVLFHFDCLSGCRYDVDVTFGTLIMALVWSTTWICVTYMLRPNTNLSVGHIMQHTLSVSESHLVCVGYVLRPKTVKHWEYNMTAPRLRGTSWGWRNSWHWPSGVVNSKYQL
jgi:hypothetical protein